jgi:hypothetical protein
LFSPAPTDGILNSVPTPPPPFCLTTVQLQEDRSGAAGR